MASKNVTTLTEARFEQLGYGIYVTEQSDGTLQLSLVEEDINLVLPKETISAIYRTFKCGAFA